MFYPWRTLRGLGLYMFLSVLFDVFEARAYLGRNLFRRPFRRNAAFRYGVGSGGLQTRRVLFGDIHSCSLCHAPSVASQQSYRLRNRRANGALFPRFMQQKI